jgi:hypothetical protein
MEPEYYDGDEYGFYTEEEEGEEYIQLVFPEGIDSLE